MNKYFFFLLAIIITSCSDGDLQIEALDFDSSALDFCSDLEGGEDIDRTLFFLISDDETLILELQSGLIDNVISDDNTSTIGSNTDLTYRLFSDNITNSYFCDDIPPVTPTVLEEIPATAGTVTVETTLDTVTATNKNYNHQIIIDNVSLENSAGERLTDEAGFDFGLYTTTIENSFEQEFSNYADIDTQLCQSSETTITTYKVLNDELIALTLPSDLLINQVTTEARTADFISEAITFDNTYYSTNITIDNFCTETLDNNLLLNNFSAISGTISINTVEAEDSTAEIPLFTHTILLTNFIMEDLDGTDLDEITSFTFGTITTGTN